jgi:hypothetical protein
MTFASGDPYRHLTLYRKALIVVHRHRPRSAGETASSAVLDEVKPRTSLFPLDFLRHLCHRTIYFHPIGEPPGACYQGTRQNHAVLHAKADVPTPSLAKSGECSCIFRRSPGTGISAKSAHGNTMPAAFSFGCTNTQHHWKISRLGR